MKRESTKLLVTSPYQMARKKQQRKLTTIELLTDDLMMEIFHCLPLKSMIQCVSVCKRWQSLISNSPFLQCNPFLISVRDGGARWKYRCIGRGNMHFSKDDIIKNFLRENANNSTRIVASCNGLFVALIYGNGTVWCYVCNPWTTESFFLPHPTEMNYFLLGLAFEGGSRINSTSDNLALYKVVTVRRIRIDPSQEVCYGFEIYNSRSNEWQVVERASKIHTCGEQRGPKQDAVYCNRVLHWRCCGENHALMFNLRTKISQFFDLPSGNGDPNIRSSISSSTTYFHSRLIEFQGQLHYIQVSNTFQLNIWKMLAASNGCCNGWLILHSVDLDRAVERNMDFFNGRNKWPHFRQCFEPIDMGFGGEDKVLLHDSGKKIILYDLKRDVFELVAEGIGILERFFFRYTPITKFIYKRKKEKHGDVMVRSQQRIRWPQMSS